jgi:NAD(P)H-quinone oxidoreductase subunit 4
VPIIGIGLYPKLATQTYDAKTVAVTSEMRNAFSIVAQENPHLYSNGFNVPQISAVKPQILLGTVK